MTAKIRLNAWRDLARRYRQATVLAWMQRRRLTPPRLRIDEAEFLPAALSLQARPVSPSGRWTARCMILFAVSMLLWSVFGTIDIFVSAGGRVISSQRTKTISSVEVASVHSVHVVEGQAVQAGDLLVALDTRVIDSERVKAQADGWHAQLEVARSRALLSALAAVGGGEPVLVELPGVPVEQWRDAQRQLQGQWHDFLAKRRRLDGEVERYGQAMPLVTRRALDYSELLAANDVSRHAWAEKEQARIDLQGQLDDARNQRTALITETRKSAQEALANATRLAVDMRQDERRAAAHSSLLNLVAPVAGTVQQLTVHTIGGVVPAVQPLMEIVPAHGNVEVEAFIENRDVGFVQEGQTAAVKIDAFEYTKYGTVPGKVSHVSRDAIPDEKRGPVYSVKVTLDRNALKIDGREVPLGAGLACTVDIRTGERRVIEYVLAPLLQHANESLHER